jgi:class 3 adenylate cyclase
VKPRESLRPSAPDPALVDQLAAFAPVDLVGRLHAVEPALKTPVLHVAQGAVLFSDISGFSHHADRLFARSGAESTEALTKLLDDRFSPWIRLVRAFGGEVVKFAGDALLAVFWAGSEGNVELTRATDRALRCALAIQRAHPATDDTQLSQRVRVGAGKVAAARLGGYRTRWEAILCGDAVRQIARKTPRLLAGEVGASAEAWGLCRARFAGQQDQTGGAVLQGGSSARPPSGTDSAPPTPEALERCVPFVPDHVRGQLRLGAGAFLAEHRPLTVLFVGLPELDPTSEVGFELTQQAVVGLQQRLEQNQGAFDKLSVDDKGISMLAAFGLPPSPPGHRAVAGLSTALELAGDLDDLGVSYSIAVASGRTFCGPVGSQERREYTIIGTAVNRAARMMTGSNLPISCDGETRRQAGDFLRFEEQGSQTFRGIDEPVQVFCPVRADPRATAGSLRRATQLSGREKELERLFAGLALAEAGERSTVVLTGPAGIGKSTLTAELVVEAGFREIPSAEVRGSPALRSTPFAVWRPLFEARLGLDAEASQEALRDQLRQHLEGDAELLRAMPLLEPLLLLGLQDNEYTKQLDGTNRAAVAIDLMLRLFATGLEGNGLLVLDDLQWYDTGSLQLALEIARRVPGLMTVGLMGEAAPQAQGPLSSLVEEGELVELEGLDQAGVQALIQQTMGRSDAALALSRWLWQRTGGNPLFCEELLSELSARDVLGPMPSASGVTETLDELTLPLRVEDAVMERFNRLSPAQQLVVKTASAAGQVFRWQLLKAVLPIERTDQELRDDVAAAVGCGLLTPVDGAEGWSFTHGIGLDVSYRTMVGSQRATIHRAVAGHLEEIQADSPRRSHALLAHHWSRAGEDARAFDAYDAALDQAAADGLQQQVIILAGRALELFESHVDQTASLVPPIRRARWLQRRAYAHNEVTAYPAAEQDVIRMADLLGHPVPTKGAGWGLHLLRQVVRQLLHRTLPSLFMRSWHKPDAALRIAAQGVNTLISTSYWMSKSAVEFPTTALWTLNLSERAGMRTPRACLSAVGSFCGGLGLKRAADRYFERGRREAGGDLNLVASHCLSESVYGAMYGLPDISDSIGQLGLVAARKLGVTNLLSQNLQAWGFTRVLLGRWRDGLEAYSEAAELAAANAHWKDEFNAQARRAALLFQLGRDDEGAQIAERARGLHSDSSPLVDRVIMAALEGWLSLRRADVTAALESAERSLDLLGARPRVDPGNLDPILQNCEVLLAALRTTPEADRAPLEQRLKGALKHLGTMSMAFPVARPPVLILRGRVAAFQGKPAAAAKLWTKAIKAARKVGHALGEALARRELGLHEHLSLADRRGHLLTAMAVFEEKGLLPYAEQCREHLGLLPGPASEVA